MKGRLFIKLPYRVAPSPQKTMRLLVERPLNFIQPFVHLSLGGRLLEKFLMANQSIGDGFPAGTDTSSWCWGPVLGLGNLKEAKICPHWRG
jgi:hypothetical protein